MKPHERDANRIGFCFGLMVCSLGGATAAGELLPAAPEIAAYCEGRAVALPQGERAIASAGCRILAAGVAESLARKDLAGAMDQLRALDERMKERVVLPAPERCPPPPQCPAATAPIACAPEPVRRPSTCCSSDSASLAPRPPRAPRPIVHALPREREVSTEPRNPFAEPSQRRSKDRSDASASAKPDTPVNPFSRPKPAERPASAPSRKRRQARDLMDPFPAHLQDDVYQPSQ